MYYKLYYIVTYNMVYYIRKYLGDFIFLINLTLCLIEQQLQIKF